MGNAVEKKARCCSEEANRARREEILQTATEIFAEQGFSDAATQALAERLKVGKGTIYRHFPSKRALFLAATDRVMRKLQDCVCENVTGIEDGLERIERGITTFLQFFADHPSFVELLIQERAYFKDRKRPTYFEHRETNIQRWKQLYRDLMAAGRMREMPVDRISTVVSNVLYGIMVTNFFNGQPRRWPCRRRRSSTSSSPACSVSRSAVAGWRLGRERMRMRMRTDRRPATGTRGTGLSEARMDMKRRWWMLLSMPLLAAMAAGCQQAKSGPVRTPPIAVYDTPITRTVTDFEEFPGETDSPYSVHVMARVSGYMIDVPFPDGAMVHKGAKLFQIDDRMYRADLDRAEGTVKQYEAHVERLQKEYTRARNLIARGSISQEEHDRYKADLEEAEANVKVAIANRDLARLNLEWCEVTRADRRPAQPSARHARQPHQGGHHHTHHDRQPRPAVRLLRRP